MVKPGLAAVLALIGAAPAVHWISAYQGGHVHSPDGRWTVSAQAIDPDGEAMRTTAWLAGPGVKRRSLTRFERGLEVRWHGDIGKLVLIERTIHFSRIVVGTLGPREIGPPDRIQADIEQGLAKLRRLGTIGNRIIAFGDSGQCVLAEESGLPPGWREGSYVARSAMFRLDVATGRAVPVKDCPGARID